MNSDIKKRIEKVNRVSQWAMHLGSEVEYIATSPMHAKYKIMLLMVYVDIFSQVWDTSLGQPHKTQKDRFTTWLDKFVFNGANATYRDNQDELDPLDSVSVYKIRNSLLHFGGLPRLNLPVFIADYNKSTFREKHKSEIAARDVLVLCPGVLFPAIAYAVAATFTKFADQQATNPTGYEDLMIQLYDKLQDNCALPIQSAN